MFRSIKRFLANTKGAFAIQFAMLAIPLTVCTGLAIDGGRAFLARFELASALDAAALAVGSTLQPGANLNDVARTFVEKNFRTPHNGPITLELATAEETLVLRGSVRIDTYFMPLVGQPHVDISAESEVRQGGNNVEVALALDITGSMNETRMTGLRNAANLLIDEVVSPIQPPQAAFFSRAAIIPWSEHVSLTRTGSSAVSHVNNTVVTELRGTPIGSTGIAAATWRAPSASNKTIDKAGWRVGTGKAISDVTWRRGAALTISEITKTNSNTRIRVRVSASSSTYYANGDIIYISSADGSYTSLNGNRYKVADRTTSSPYYFWLQNVGTSTYTTPPSNSTNASVGSSQRCLTAACELRVTANGHGYSAGDFIYINGVDTTGSGSSPNNSWGTTYTAAAVDTNTFVLSGTNGPSFATYDDDGTASKCYVSNCRYRVTTSTNHGFSELDFVAIWGMTQVGSNTSAHSSLNSSWRVENPSGTVFYLPGEGRNYRDWTSGGSAAVCELTTCNVRITSAGNGISADERVVITGAGGMTGLNTCNLNTSGTCAAGTRLVWTVLDDGNPNDNTLTLADTGPTVANMAANYTANSAVSQCTNYGCNRLWYKTPGNAERVFRPSPCMIERPGDDAFTDANPAAAPLGILYTGSGACAQTNYVTPLTSNRDRLFDAIEDLDTDGSTAGQLGVAWGWYMLSNNFATVWDREDENVPRPSEFAQLARVLVLMTDGEFNYSTCDGVASTAINTSLCVPNNANDTTLPNRDVSFRQAQALCNAMRADGIIIYTVGLQLNNAGFSDDFLLACASSPQNAFLADNNEQLEAAFREIAVSISRLRIAR